MLLVAGSEPPALRAIATKVTNMPENYGVDVYFMANGRKVGIQRKEIKDLLASVNDGRLVKEILQMKALDYKILLVEGRPVYSNDGFLLSKIFGQRWTRDQIDQLLWSVQDRGVWVIQTGDLQETVGKVQLLKRWFEKSKHTSLWTRPGLGKAGLFGTGVQDRDYGIWFLQSLPGVGYELASRIYDKYGFPFTLELTVEELMAVDGIGKGKAEKIVQVCRKMEESDGQ